MLGIYKIENSINGKIYIGSSVNTHKRWISHKCDFNKKRHPNKHMQNVYNKYGIDVLIFSVIEMCDKSELKEREQYYIDELKPEYNILKEAYSVFGENHPMYGKKHSKESIDKIKKARKNQIIKHSKETKNKIGESNKGRKITDSHLEKMINARKGLIVWNKGINTSIEPKNKIKINPNEIIEMYRSGMSIESIRKKLKYSWDVVKRILLENNISIRNISEQKKITDKNKT